VAIDGLHLTLVLGGARSGKSRCAESIAMSSPPPWTYIATAESLDDEMAARIAHHKSRRSHDWRTIDAPLDLAGALTALPRSAVVLVDCLTLWLSNLMLAERDIDAETLRLEQAMLAHRAPLVLVSNEVGLGIVPENALARRFRDCQGHLNQQVAARADRVILVVAGLPVIVNGQP
jgi:adenosylcobinamide kinase / adenosylcobinamide-phosphate guanylyltransferase